MWTVVSLLSGWKLRRFLVAPASIMVMVESTIRVIVPWYLVKTKGSRQDEADRMKQTGGTRQEEAVK